MWWDQRRPEIVESFDREILGRLPKNTPAVTWQVTSTATEKNGDVPSSPKISRHVEIPPIYPST